MPTYNSLENPAKGRGEGCLELNRRWQEMPSRLQPSLAVPAQSKACQRTQRSELASGWNEQEIFLPLPASGNTPCLGSWTLEPPERES